jgi:hypothetical protein
MPHFFIFSAPWNAEIWALENASGPFSGYCRMSLNRSDAPGKFEMVEFSTGFRYCHRGFAPVEPLEPVTLDAHMYSGDEDNGDDVTSGIFPDPEPEEEPEDDEETQCSLCRNIIPAGCSRVTSLDGEVFCTDDCFNEALGEDKAYCARDEYDERMDRA